MKYNYVLGMGNPSIREKTKTEQFKLSELILDLRYELDLDTVEMAKIVQVDINKYLKMEYGENSIQVNDYVNAISKLQAYQALEPKNKVVKSKGLNIEKVEVTQGIKSNIKKPEYSILNIRKKYNHIYKEDESCLAAIA